MLRAFRVEVNADDYDFLCLEIAGTIHKGQCRIIDLHQVIHRAPEGSKGKQIQAAITPAGRKFNTKMETSDRETIKTRADGLMDGRCRTECWYLAIQALYEEGFLFSEIFQMHFPRSHFTVEVEQKRKNKGLAKLLRRLGNIFRR